MKKGFTLVELIVVITIIMVITALGVVNFAGINKRSRDSRRVADLKKVSIALEIYRQENGEYPSAQAGLVPDYLEIIPLDPKNPTNLYDLDIGEKYSYELYAHMEDSGSTTGTYSGGSCGETCNYRTINP